MHYHNGGLESFERQGKLAVDTATRREKQQALMANMLERKIRLRAR